MNQLTKHLMCLTALVSAVNLFGDGTTSKIIPRSQSFNAARQIVGWNNVDWGIHRKPQDESYSSFNMIFEYTRTFRDNRLAKALFGNDLICNSCDESSIQIMGSAVANRPATAWLAENFGLPTDFQSTVNFSPRITNYILEFSYFAGLDAWLKGSYFKIYAPFVHTSWNLNAKECNITQGTTGYFQGYFSSAVVPAAQLNNSFLSYANGCTPFINNDYDLNYQDTCYATVPACTPLGDITWNPLCCSKISPECCCEGVGLSKNGFGEIRFILGYDFLNDEAGDYHMGLGAYVAAPTGSRIGEVDCDGNGKGRYLFEPIVGNGKHWEFGGQLTAHSVWWRNEDILKSLTFYLEANVTHLFKACQTRCFDLCSAGSNSRYMIAERLQSNRNSYPGLNQTTFGQAPLASGSDTLVADSLGLEFGNAYAPVANVTRRNVTSTIGAQGDAAFTLSYKSNNFQWDIGYDFWGRTCEKLEIKDGCCNSNETQWALKGDQRVYGFTYNRPNTGEALAVRIPATDSKANIHTGSNLAHDVTPLSTSVNFYADNSYQLNPAAIGSGEPYGITTLPLGTSNIYTSETPVVINENDFNLNGTRGISNKIFTHFNYAWPHAKDGKWSPYVGLGLEVECGGGGSNCCKDDCDTSCNTTCNPCGTPCYTYPACNSTPCAIIESCCSNIALSQWGIWFKIGTSYN